MANFKDFGAGAEAWKMRADRMRAAIPSNFKQAMARVLFESRSAIDSEVYATGGGRRSGDLKNREVVQMTGPLDAILTNTVLPAISAELLQRLMRGEPMSRVHVKGEGGEFGYAFD